MKVREAAIVQREVTAEEYMLLPSVDDARDELVNGMIEYTSFGDVLQGLTASQLLRVFDPYERSVGGLLTLRVGVICRRNPDTVRGPFLIYYTEENHPRIDDGYFETPADLIVEVAGLSNPEHRLSEKVEDYLALGCRMVWVLHPRQRTLTVYQSMDDVHQYNEEDHFEGGNVLPGFSCTVAELFGEIRS